jgi:hypothetical protein
VPEEIDWAIGPYAAWVRFGDLRTREPARACRIGRWLTGIWLTPDAPVADWRDDVRSYVNEECRP